MSSQTELSIETTSPRPATCANRGGESDRSPNGEGTEVKVKEGSRNHLATSQARMRIANVVVARVHVELAAAPARARDAAVRRTRTGTEGDVHLVEMIARLVEPLELEDDSLESGHRRDLLESETLDREVLELLVGFLPVAAEYGVAAVLRVAGIRGDCRVEGLVTSPRRELRLADLEDTVQGLIPKFRWNEDRSVELLPIRGVSHHGREVSLHAVLAPELLPLADDVRDGSYPTLEGGQPLLELGRLPDIEFLLGVRENGQAREERCIELTRHSIVSGSDPSTVSHGPFLSLLLLRELPRNSVLFFSLTYYSLSVKFIGFRLTE